MPSVAKIAPHLQALEAPHALRELSTWLIWRYEAHEGEPKPRKVPYYADGGRRYGKQGTREDKARLTTFTVARSAAARRGFSGVGLAPLPGSNIVALDFDYCVGTDDTLPPEVAAIAGQTYTEYSPSGRGLRCFFKGNVGNRKSDAKDGVYGFQTFSTSGFVTFTGQLHPIADIIGHEDHVAKLTPEVLALCEQRFATAEPTADESNPDFMAGHEPKIGLSIAEMMEIVAQLDPDMDRDEWIKVGMGLHHETEGGDDGFDIWDEWSATGEKYPSSEALREQWESFTRRMGPGRKQVTMATAIYYAKRDADYERKRPEKVLTAEEMSAAAGRAVQDLPAPGGLHTPEGFDGKYPVYSAGALTRRAEPDWLIKNVLPAADLIVLFGASGSGKTFIALDMAAALARGTAWREQRTRKTRVLYIAAEGTGGIGRRIRAYCQHHQLKPDELDIGIMVAAPNFLDSDDITEVLIAVRAMGGVDLVIVDTFAQVTPGANENGAEDMGRALANARLLRKTSGATIVLVHHAGKDLSRGSRGWSGIRAAADAEIEVLRYESGGREVRISKMKDGDDGLQWGFKLDVVQVGVDSDGDAVTSCVAIEAEVPRPEREEIPSDKLKKYGRVERHILEIVETVEPTVQSMRMHEFIELCVSHMPAQDPTKRDTRRQHITRATVALSKGKDPDLLIQNGMVVFCT